MTLEDIKNGIIRLLDEKKQADCITGEKISQKKFDSMIHIQLIPLSSKNAAAGFFVEKEILVDIAYMEEEVTDNAKLYQKLDEMDSVFKPFFTIGNRAFSPEGQGEIVDDIGHYKMILKFTDTQPFETNEPVADRLQVDWRR